jgi:hypothetical protein
MSSYWLCSGSNVGHVRKARCGDGCSHRWAGPWRRMQRRGINTNNLCERFFGKLKYTYLGGNVNRRVSDLFILIVDEVIPSYQDRRRLLIAKRDKTKLETFTVRRAAKMTQLRKACYFIACVMVVACS